MSRRRKRVAATAMIATACVAVAVSGTAKTYAAFSDFDIVPDNQAGAATVALGIPGPSVGPKLTYTGLLPGEPKTDSFEVAYLGSIPADLALEFRPDGGSAFCDPVGDGTWTAKPGGQVQLDFGNGYGDYCAMLGQTVSIPVLSGAAPGTHVTVTADVQLASWSDFSYSGLSDVDQLTVTAKQTSTPGAGFTDWAVGTISIGIADYAPVIPAECGDPGQYKEIIEGTSGNDILAPKNGKAVIFGYGGDDVIFGGNGKDCLIGGDGDDELHGGNAPDVLIGGNGADTCYGGHAPDTYSCDPPVAGSMSFASTTTMPITTTTTEPLDEDSGTPPPSDEDPPGSEEGSGDDSTVTDGSGDAGATGGIEDTETKAPETTETDPPGDESGTGTSDAPTP